MNPRHSHSNERSRSLENWGFGVGISIMALYVIAAEIIPATMASFGKCPEPKGHPIPWGVILLVGACVLPKTLGRVTTGKIWLTALAQRAGLASPPADPAPRHPAADDEAPVQ